VNINVVQTMKSLLLGIVPYVIYGATDDCFKAIEGRNMKCREEELHLMDYEFDYYDYMEKWEEYGGLWPTDCFEECGRRKDCRFVTLVNSRGDWTYNCMLHSKCSFEKGNKKDPYSYNGIWQKKICTQEDMAKKFDLISFSKQCGENVLSRERIVNGKTAKPNSWPWIAGVLNPLSETEGSYSGLISNRLSCGGSIISSTHILTAAHCVFDDDNKLMKNLQVIVGEHDTNYDDEKCDDGKCERIVNVNCIKVHPNYNTTSGDFDFAVLRVDDMKLDGKNRNIVCLPQQGKHIMISQDDNTTACYVAGWGEQTATDGKTDGNDFFNYPSTRLQSIRLNVFTHEYCKSKFDWESLFGVDAAFCAGREDERKDSCQGDSGGPLVCVVNDVPVLYGVVSWGEGCAQKKQGGCLRQSSQSDRLDPDCRRRMRQTE